MINFKGKGVEIVVNNGDKLSKGSQAFVGLLLTLLENGIDNIAYQLHVVSKLTMGKPFADIMTGEDTTGAKAIMGILASIPRHRIQTAIKEALKSMDDPNNDKIKKTKYTIDDILGSKDEDNEPKN